MTTTLAKLRQALELQRTQGGGAAPDPVKAMRAYERNVVAAYRGLEALDDDLRKQASKAMAGFALVDPSGTTTSALRRRFDVLQAVPGLAKAGVAEGVAPEELLRKCVNATFDCHRDMSALAFYLKNRDAPIGAFNLSADAASKYRAQYSDLPPGETSVSIFDLIEAERSPAPPDATLSNYATARSDFDATATDYATARSDFDETRYFTARSGDSTTMTASEMGTLEIGTDGSMTVGSSVADTLDLSDDDAKLAGRFAKNVIDKMRRMAVDNAGDTIKAVPESAFPSVPGMPVKRLKDIFDDGTLAEYAEFAIQVPEERERFKAVFDMIAKNKDAVVATDVDAGMLAPLESFPSAGEALRNRTWSTGSTVDLGAGPPETPRYGDTIGSVNSSVFDTVPDLRYTRAASTAQVRPDGPDLEGDDDDLESVLSDTDSVELRKYFPED